jgi:DNA replication ATP-dependent helicase Dna2
VHEGDIVVRLLDSFEKIYEYNNQAISTESIGVITPYRAQIARVLKNIELSQIESKDKITVDTVERYQGGARDIIILSTTVNFLFQMNSLISESEEGIDRKLNVAFTRAREQFILIGNEEILRRNAVYADLIDRSYRLEMNP